MNKRFAIVTSGGPAPGINAAISAAGIEGINLGWEVFGIQGGFESLSKNGLEAVKNLTIEMLSPIYNQGGAILGTSRFSPLLTEKDSTQFKLLLDKLKINHLIVIGGEGSATLSYKITERFPDITIAHIPKTIDNDLPLPEAENSFGYESARAVGSSIVDTLRLDARTCGRWYLVESMGRQAGFLTMGIALASGASTMLIPEEFSDRLYTPNELATVLVKAIVNRAKQGKKYGVALLAEGLLDRLSPNSSPLLDDNCRDTLGRLTYSEIELCDVIKPEIIMQLECQGLDIVFKNKNIGYELRCATPVASDIEYSRFLGYGAVQFLEDCINKLGTKIKSAMICRVDKSLRFVPIHEMITDHKIKGRVVELTSDTYKLARRFMS